MVDQSLSSDTASYTHSIADVDGCVDVNNNTFVVVGSGPSAAATEEPPPIFSK